MKSLLCGRKNGISLFNSVCGCVSVGGWVGGCVCERKNGISLSNSALSISTMFLSVPISI